MNEFSKALISDKRNNAISEENDLFGQFVGAWKFDGEYLNDNNEMCKSKGEWIFSWVLEGRAIQDVFIWPPRGDRDGCMANEYGTTIRSYNQNTGKWDIVYINPGYVVKLEAEKVRDNIVLTEVTEGKIIWQFSDITPTSFTWQSILRDDNNNQKVIGTLKVYK